jgi:hypothetical protein
MIAASRAGATAGDVAKAGLALLPEAARQSALAYGLGAGVGAALDCAPTIRPDNADELIEGALLSLRVVARLANGLALASGLVEVGREGARLLEPAARPGPAGRPE